MSAASCAGALAAGDLFAGLVALGLPAFAGGDGFAALAVERAKGVEIDARAALGGHLLVQRQILAEVAQVMHGRDRIAQHSRS